MLISVIGKVLRWLGRQLTWVLAGVMWVAAIALCAITLPKTGAPVISIVLVGLLLAVTVWAHEGGHYLGARLMGMRVMRLCASFVDIVPQRRGLRWRWRRVRGLAGFVYALPQPGQAMRPAYLVFAAGGPVANFLLAALGGGVAWLCWPAPVVGVVLASVVINAMVGLMNLLPSSDGRLSDGMLLLAWGRGVDERGPMLAFTRLSSYSVFGRTADALLSHADLAEVERQPSPAPLFALWYRVKAAQNCADWADTPALRQVFDAQMQALAPALRAGLRELTDLLRVELAFSEAMRMCDEAPLRELALSPDVAWLVPTLQPRLDALRAALKGDRAACERALDAVRRYAENEVDAALAPSEARIAAALRARFGIAPWPMAS